jgi:hypothetical protein
MPLMASAKQMEANRRNALNSTGPRTEAGKLRSRSNAIRHGLTAETVVEALEDAQDYRAFEMAIAAEFEGRTAVERELVLRLASLLWRLRRATAMEAGLLTLHSQMPIQIEPAEDEEPQLDSGADIGLENGNIIHDKANGHANSTDEAAGGLNWADAAQPDGGCSREPDSPGDPDRSDDRDCVCTPGRAINFNIEIASCFLHLNKQDSGAFERLSRYEAALWRQVGQVLLTLECLRWRR